jgi:hypothetical protein
METVSKGATLHTVWSLYDPASPTTLVDPDEYPEAPRFNVYDVDGITPVTGFSDFLYTLRRGPGVFSLNLPIPLAGTVMPPTAFGKYYTLRLNTGSRNGQNLVQSDGSQPEFQFAVEDTANAYLPDRPYTTPDEMVNLYGIDGPPTVQQVRFAQGLCDDWMHRSLWPSIFEKERYSVQPDRNLVLLSHRPVTRIFSVRANDPVDASGVVGRYGYGRRDRRTLNQINANYLSVMAVLGSPPRFVPIRAEDIEFNPYTGECWLPSGFFLVNYSQVEFTYEAGFRVIPERVKRAVAVTLQFVRLKGFGPLMNWTVGRVSHATKDPDILPGEVKRMLEPYRSKYWG